MATTIDESKALLSETNLNRVYSSGMRNYQQQLAANSLADRKRTDNAAALLASVNATMAFQDRMIANLQRQWDEETARVVPVISAMLNDRYPHVCPRCSGPAYVGAVTEVDCAGGCK